MKKIILEAHILDRGESVTKHDRSVCEEHNAWRVGLFHGAGDTEGICLPDRAYNELKDHFHEAGRRQRRRGCNRLKVVEVSAANEAPVGSSNLVIKMA